MPKFLSCFPNRRTKDDPLIQHNDDDNARIVPGCAFCSVSSEKGFDVIREDKDLIVFRDRTPRAKVHLLIIPRHHVASSVRQLTPDHLPMREYPIIISPHHHLCSSCITKLKHDIVRSMVSLAHTLVPAHPPPKMGFHIPPFSSVPHLHMHVFAGPHTAIGRFKYPVATRHGGKGLGWFVTASQVEAILEKGGIVSLGRG